jgi:hypothetical protein
VVALAGRRPVGQIERRRSSIRRPRAGDRGREACAVEEPRTPLPSCPSAMGGRCKVAETEAEGGRADEGARDGHACGLSKRRMLWVRGSDVGGQRGERGRGGGERRRRPGAGREARTRPWFYRQNARGAEPQGRRCPRFSGVEIGCHATQARRG